MKTLLLYGGRLTLLLLLDACHRGMICPAYQSSFILDDSVRNAHFSLFEGDTSFTPKQFLTDKDQYGIMEKMRYQKKYNTLKTVEMITVFPPGGSLSQDSTYVNPLDQGTPLLPPADSLDTPMITNEQP